MSGHLTTRPDEDDLEFLLCQYLDGQLSRRQRLELERRMENDEALRRELRRYAALDGYLADLARQELPGVDYNLQRAEILAAVERKVLLSAARRRPIFFRPVFGALAAAAMVLLAVALGVIVFVGPSGALPPAVSAVLLPASPKPVGTVEVTVRMTAPNLDELPLAPAGGPRDTMPPGTIVVSVSSHARGTGDLSAVEPMVIY